MCQIDEFLMIRERIDAIKTGGCAAASGMPGMPTSSGGASIDSVPGTPLGSGAPASGASGYRQGAALPGGMAGVAPGGVDAVAGSGMAINRSELAALLNLVEVEKRHAAYKPMPLDAARLAQLEQHIRELEARLGAFGPRDRIDAALRRLLAQCDAQWPALKSSANIEVSAMPTAKDRRRARTRHMRTTDTA